MTRLCDVRPVDGGWLVTARAWVGTREQAEAEQARFMAGPPSPPLTVQPPNCDGFAGGYPEEAPTTADALLALHDDKDEP